MSSQPRSSALEKNGQEEAPPKSKSQTAALLLFWGFLALLACPPTAENSISASDYSRTPVLSVHGHGMNSQSWRQLVVHLISNGYSPEYLHAIDIRPATMANIQAARKVIAPAAESLLARAPAAARSASHEDLAPQRLDIVVHRMGAVSSRFYATQLQPDRVRTWVSLAGANHGTKALCRYDDEAARQMCPAFATTTAQSEVQVALNGTRRAPLDETPSGLGVDRKGVTSVPADDSRKTLYLTVRVNPDEWIEPERSTVLDSAGGVTVKMPIGMRLREGSPGNFLLLEKVGHDALLRHQGAIHLSSREAIGTRQEMTRTTRESSWETNST